MIKENAQRMYISENNRWVEPLYHSIGHGLVQAINSGSGEIRAEYYKGASQQSFDYTIKVQILEFFPTENNQVLHKGRYSIYDKSKTLIASNFYSFNQPQTMDGFSHSIERLNQTLNLLAEQIVGSL